MVRILPSASLLVVLAGLCGCGRGPGSADVAKPAASTMTATGVVHGGQNPVSGATIQLWAVGNTGYGSAATPLISATLTTSDGTGTTDSNANAGNANNTLPTGNFTITGDYTCPASDPYVYITASGGNPGLTAGTNNSAIVLMAALTDCNTLKANAATTFITINEVTTVASVYALAQFMGPSGSIGYFPSSSQGIVNAFAAVGNMVNIGTGTARSTTLNGTGYVPQAEIDSLAGAIAPCVNSSSSTSTACNSLFSAAPAGSLSTLLATRTIALNPGANVSAVYTLIGGSPPFPPTLTSVPNDWTVALAYDVSGATHPHGMALDSAGNVWITNWNGNSPTSPQVMAMSNSGVPSNYIYTDSAHLNGPQGIAVDLLNHVWIANTNNSSAASLYLNANNIDPAYAPLTTSGASLNAPVKVAADPYGNIWFTNSGNNTVTELTPSSGGFGSGYTTSVYSGSGLSSPNGIAIDASGNAWIANQTGASITEFLPQPGGTLEGAVGNNYSGGGLNEPDSVSIDGSGNLWMTDYVNNEVAELSSSGSPISTSGGYTAGGVNDSFGLSIDGAGNVWVPDENNNRLTELNSSGVAISPGTGYQSASLGQPGFDAIDASGNVWVLNASPVTLNGPETLTEFIGLAAPTFMPVAQAVANAQLGQRPGTLAIETTTASISTGNVAAFYDQGFNAAGGSGNYSWAILNTGAQSGQLTALQNIGLSFTSSGTLSGTPTATGSYPFTVKLTDTTTGGTLTAAYTLVINAATQTVCSHDGTGNAVLNGNYAFLLSGFNPGGHFFDEIGDFKADGGGNIKNGNADANGDQNIANFSSGEVQYTFSGTYSIGSADDRGIMTVSNSNSGTPGTGLPASTSYCFAADNVVAGVAQGGHIIQADSSGFILTGIFQIQTPADFTTAALGNSYAFGMQGVDGTTPNRRGMTGQFTLNGSGGLTSGQLDTANLTYNGTTYVNNYSAANAIASSGSSYSVASTGRGTLTLEAGGNPLSFVTYVAGTGNQLFLLASNASSSGTTPLLVGSAMQQTTTSFTTANVKATSAFRASGAVNPNTPPILDVVRVGQYTFDGAGNFSLVQDQNSGGVITTPATNDASGTYTVSSLGYLTVGGGPDFYLFAPGAGFGLGTGFAAPLYFMVPQVLPSGGFTSSNLYTYSDGNYGVGTLFPSAYNNNDGVPGVFDASVILTSSGTAATVTLDEVNEPGTSAFISTGQTIPETFRLDPAYGPTTGRTFFQQQGQTFAVGYIVSPTQIFLIQAQSGTDGLIIQADHQ